MSAAAALAALASLLACAALRDLLSGRAVPWGRLRAPRLPGKAQLLAKLGGAALGGLVGAAAAPAAPGRLALLVAIGLPVAGFVAPDAWQARQTRRRHARLLAALPDALDLLAVGATAGRPLQAGFGQIARTGEGPLADELRIVEAELGCGLPLAAALRALRARVPGSEIATLCAALERSSRLGSPLADQLRRQASSLRRDRGRVVQEQAARAAPKIQLVVALVLVPSVLLTIVAGLIANADLLFSGF